MTNENECEHEWRGVWLRYENPDYPPRYLKFCWKCMSVFGLIPIARVEEIIESIYAKRREHRRKCIRWQQMDPCTDCCYGLMEYNDELKSAIRKEAKA